MRVNPTVVLTFVLLSLMFGAGLSSAIYGYRLGRGALQGITQPDARPVNNLADTEGQPIRRDGLTFLKESDILSSVKARIAGNPDPAGASDSASPTAPASAQ
jgi:hypothetical protein